MKKNAISPKYLMGLLIITLVICVSTSVMAQVPLLPPPPFFPAIRTSPFQGYPGILGAPLPLPVPAIPEPVVRTAATTITLWSTVGTANALIVYNPTTLIGVPAPPVSPSPLLSLIAGVLLTPIGHSALSTTNPILFNYLVNSYLLPTGLGIYVFP